MNDLNNLKKELDEKIHILFKDNKAYLDYILQTKKNFLHRYLETSTDKDLTIASIDDKTLLAISYEANMGSAFKITNAEIKEGIKNLAKNVPREKNPRVQYSLKTTLEDVKGENGKLILEAKINWNYPDYKDDSGHFKKQQVIFEYHDTNTFRKQLALKYEEVCELFL